MTEYKGYDLFNDIDDETLRTRNRAVVLANIAEDNMNKESRITPKGASLVMGYFAAIPEQERAIVFEKFKQSMQERGFQVVPH